MRSPLPALRYAARSLLRSREFAASVVIALALGAGVGVPFLALARSGLSDPGPYTAAARAQPGAPAEVLFGAAGATPIAAAQDGGLGILLGTLQGLGLLVLVVAGVNAAILLLARASARRRENAVRAALGATRGRIARLLAAEAWLLAGAGAAGAGVVAGAGALLVAASRPGALPPAVRASLATAVAWMPLLALAAVCALFCVAPAVAAGRRDLRNALGAGTHATAGPAEGRLRDALAVLALAASVALAVSAGLLARAGAAPAGAEAGIDPRGTLTAQVDLRSARWAGPAARAAAYAGLLERLAASGAQVKAESLSSVGAWRGMGAEDRVRVVCGTCVRANILLPVLDGTARYHAVSPGFFAAMGGAVTAGRELEPGDRAGAAPVAVVDETFAYQLFPNGDPLGKKVRIGPGPGQWVTVVGVVRRIRPPGIGNGSVPVPSIYVSALQFPPRVVGLAVRTAGDPLAAAPALRRAVAAAAPGASVGSLSTLERSLAADVEPLRWFGLLFRVMAACAALLAAVGLYGTVSYGVARRTREIGVRMALGATGGAVVRWVALRCLRLARRGGLLGLGAALCIARLLQFSFTGVPLFDPALYGGVVALLGAVALAAGIRPALRAVRIDPVAALRAE